MTPDTETYTRGLALALRDFCEHNGAIQVSATFPGAQTPVTFSYVVGTGCTVHAGERLLTVPDEALDEVGYVPADVNPSSSFQPSQEPDTAAFNDPEEPS